MFRRHTHPQLKKQQFSKVLISSLLDSCYGHYRCIFLLPPYATWITTLLILKSGKVFYMQCLIHTASHTQPFITSLATQDARVQLGTEPLKLLGRYPVLPSTPFMISRDYRGPTRCRMITGHFIKQYLWPDQ